MSKNATDALRALLDTSLDALPDQVRLSIQIDLARQLLADSLLTEAADLLESIGTSPESSGRRDIAAQWITLARAQDKRGQNSPAEAALRVAAELDPPQALPVLAQNLQRQKRWTDAAAIWRQVIELVPDEPNAYLSLARIHERLDQPEQAVAVYMELVEVAPTARTYLTVAARLQELESNLPDGPTSRQVRVALIGNATLDHLASYVRVECVKAGLRPSLYQAPFDQVTQEILNPNSGLYAFEPDIVICAIHASRLFPHLHHDPFELSVAERRAEVEAGLANVRNLLDTFTQRSSAMVLLHNMVVPQHPALGTLDWRDELGQNELFGEINRRLAELARAHYRTVYIVDEERVQARAGKLQATDPRLWLTARVAWREGVHLGLAREYVRFIKPYRNLTRKCIVLDLDNTLWGGVIGEDGLDGIQLGADAPGNAFVAFQRVLERLWRRGILLAVCSKNNLDDALPAFDHPAMILKRQHIAAHRINWQPKAANLREIAAELNIGLDSLVFLDDNPVERAAVQSELPDVLVPELPADPALYRSALLELDVFESLALTAEDRERGRLYAEQAQRREYESSTQGTSIEDYLAGLHMIVEISPASAATLPRIAQLTNKTNQFNVTTRRYSEANVVDMADHGCDVYGMRVTDRFGDNGLVGVAILGALQHDGAREIDTLLLSCRVMGRGVETALLAFLAYQARSTGATTLRGRFIPTGKNAPARDCFASNGFRLVEQLEDGAQIWDLDASADTLTSPSWLTVRTPALVA